MTTLLQHEHTHTQNSVTYYVEAFLMAKTFLKNAAMIAEDVHKLFVMVPSPEVGCTWSLYAAIVHTSI